MIEAKKLKSYVLMKQTRAHPTAIVNFKKLFVSEKKALKVTTSSNKTVH